MVSTNQIYEVLKLIRPFDISLPKKRFGHPFDGGYIFADNMTNDQVVLSYGIGDNATFELDNAQIGHQFNMFDHTIRELP